MLINWLIIIQFNYTSWSKWGFKSSSYLFITKIYLFILKLEKRSILRIFTLNILSMKSKWRGRNCVPLISYVAEPFLDNNFKYL